MFDRKTVTMAQASPHRTRPRWYLNTKEVSRLRSPRRSGIFLIVPGRLNLPGQIHLQQEIVGYHW